MFREAILSQLLAVALGGAVGAMLRYLVGIFMKTQLGEAFPWGTLTVNLVGCFLIGALFPLLSSATVSVDIRHFLLTGLLGALTTFSTFGLNTMQLVENGLGASALFNILLNNGLGIGLVFLGAAAARLFTR